MGAVRSGVRVNRYEPLGPADLDSDETVLVGAYGQFARAPSDLYTMSDDHLDLRISGRERAPLMRRLSAMAAPTAIHAGAVTGGPGWRLPSPR